MTSATLTETRSGALADVTRWRVEQLLAAGYDGESALVLALDREVDLHLAVSLLECGCPVDTALAILF